MPVSLLVRTPSLTLSRTLSSLPSPLSCPPPQVLELVVGGELFYKLASQGRFDEETARMYFQQLMGGVEYCHAQVRWFENVLSPLFVLCFSHYSTGGWLLCWEPLLERALTRWLPTNNNGDRGCSTATSSRKTFCSTPMGISRYPTLASRRSTRRAPARRRFSIPPVRGSLSASSSASSSS